MHYCQQCSLNASYTHHKIVWLCFLSGCQSSKQVALSIVFTSEDFYVISGNESDSNQSASFRFIRWNWPRTLEKRTAFRTENHSLLSHRGNSAHHYLHIKLDHINSHVHASTLYVSFITIAKHTIIVLLLLLLLFLRFSIHSQLDSAAKALTAVWMLHVKWNKKSTPESAAKI